MSRYKYNITTSAVPSECLGQKIHLLPYFILYLKPFYNSSTHSKVNDIKYASYTPTLIFNLLKDSLLIALTYKSVMNRIAIFANMQIFDMQHTEQNEINSSTFFRNCSSSTFLLQLQITALKNYPDKYLSLWNQYSPQCVKPNWGSLASFIQSSFKIKHWNARTEEFRNVMQQQKPVSQWNDGYFL